MVAEPARFRSLTQRYSSKWNRSIILAEPTAYSDPVYAILQHRETILNFATDLLLGRS